MDELWTTNRLEGYLAALLGKQAYGRVTEGSLNQQCRVRRLPCACGQGIFHDAVVGVFKSKHMAHLMHDHGQGIDAPLLALVTRFSELTVVVRRLIDEPAPAGRVVIEPDGPAGSHA